MTRKNKINTYTEHDYFYSLKLRSHLRELKVIYWCFGLPVMNFQQSILGCAMWLYNDIFILSHWVLTIWIFIIVVVFFGGLCRRTVDEYDSLIRARDRIDNCNLCLHICSKGFDYAATFSNNTTNLSRMTKNPINCVRCMRISRRMFATKIAPLSSFAASLLLRFWVRTFVRKGSPIPFHTTTKTSSRAQNTQSHGVLRFINLGIPTTLTHVPSTYTRTWVHIT